MGKVELKIGIDAELLAKAEASGVSVEHFLDSELRAALASTDRIRNRAARQQSDSTGAEARALQWEVENVEAIKAHKARIARRGVFGTDLRRW